MGTTECNVYVVRGGPCGSRGQACGLGDSKRSGETGPCWLTAGH